MQTLPKHFEYMFPPARIYVEQLLRHVGLKLAYSILVYFSHLRIHWWDKPQVNHVAANNSGLKTFMCKHKLLFVLFFTWQQVRLPYPLIC